MIIPGQIIKTKWNNNNREWYESLGYGKYERNKELEVKAEDAIHSSQESVNVQCDECGTIYITSISQCWKQQKNMK